MYIVINVIVVLNILPILYVFLTFFGVQLDRKKIFSKMKNLQCIANGAVVIFNDVRRIHRCALKY